MLRFCKTMSHRSFRGGHPVSVALFLLLLVCFSLPAFAGNRCYGPEQAKAEQILRLHSELMVITVTCKRASNGRDLGSAYTGFTRKHVSTIKKAEAALIDFYEVAYGGKGIDRLDRLRTKLANEFGQLVADESAPRFCGKRQDMVISMYDSPPRSLEQAALRRYAAARTQVPLCSRGRKTASRGK